MGNRRLPAEWEPQSAIMLTWPFPGGPWGEHSAAVEDSFVAIARAAAEDALVLITCRDGAHEAALRTRLGRAGIAPERLRVFQCPANDCWARDHGPVTVLDNGRPKLLDFRFNGWGGKFAADLDDAITARLHRAGAFGTTPLEALDLVLEGGSIESDGAGTLLTTAQCLLNPNRNPDLDQAGIEARLGEILGVERFLWLRHGHIEGDDTDAHVDTLARFADPETIVHAACEDPADPDFPGLQAMARELAALATAAGKPYRLVPLPAPQPVFDSDGTRLPAGYANFLITNRQVLVPVFADAADDRALGLIRESFPGRRVLGIDCRPLIHQYGALHCVSMQIPAGVVA